MVKFNKAIPHEQFWRNLESHRKNRPLSGAEVKRIVWTDPAKADVRSLSMPLPCIFFPRASLCVIGRGRRERHRGS